ncbi:MATE family efflux transporter [Bacillus aquiflavi]|uniref:MATE family efflux transporter n=1 Tax=Bacillus aquiflavi TaxID=2672567 RepID=UPI001CA8A304|nr:MATE family efflux transporter [Bacillus aquiflavi]UAC49869.1 MATE family efflux transporter [Bacillus aquiflavi]
MKQTKNIKEKIHQLLIIFFPILITQLGMFSMNFFDTMMSGHASPLDLAGVAIGSSLWVPIFTGLSGILLAITPIVSQLVGAKKEKDASFSVIQGIYLAVIMAIIVIIAGAFLLNPVLNRMSLENEVQQVAHDYLIALSFGMVPLFIYTVLRSFIDSLEKTRTTMIITLTSLPLNVIFNYLLIFGKLGLPKLGGVGAGYASAITYWIITGIAFFIIIKEQPFASFKIFHKLYSVSFTKWAEILKIGVPIGFAIFFETSIFAAVTLLMSNFDTVTIASHQAAMNFASFLYMVPLSISMSLTIVIGFEVGAKRYEDAKQYSWIGVATGVILAVVSGLVLFSFRYEIASLYTNEQNVLNMTGQFLLYALFFQLSDAIAAPIQGALRGYKDVNSTFFMALVSYWIIGLPLGYYLANHTDLLAFGYWIGLITGLAVGAVGLSSRLVYIQKRKYKASLS